MPHILHALQALKDSKYSPPKFDPTGPETFDLFLVAVALEELEGSLYHKLHLSRLAYVTFLLGKAFNVPNLAVGMDGMDAIAQYTPIAHRLGYCDQQGVFYTAKLPPWEHLIRSSTNVNVKGIPNFFRAWFLIVLANTIVLPKIFSKMQDNCSITSFHTSLVDYYTHIAEVFIPNLFNALSRSSVTTGMRVLMHLSKLLMEFPAQILPSTLEYARRLNDYTVNNLDGLAIDEILSVLQLNEYLEVRHGQTLLSREDKSFISKYIVLRAAVLNHDNMLMLMRLKYTIFNEHHICLAPLEDKFSSCAAAEQQKFNKQRPFQHELDLLSIVKQHVKKEDRKFLRHSYVCPKTGKEVDIAFVKGTHKVSIQIDGTGPHYYLDRKEVNRKTITRNMALENAGWVNICQQLPRFMEFITIRAHIHLIKESEELLGKLKGVLPMKDSVAPSSGRKLRLI